MTVTDGLALWVGGHRDRVRGQVDAIRNVLIENIRATKEGPVACSVTGVPGRRVQGVTFRNVRLTSRGLAPRFSQRLKGPGTPRQAWLNYHDERNMNHKQTEM